MSDDCTSDFPEFDKQAKRIWNNLADWWGDQIGDGNSFQDVLIGPVTEGLLGRSPANAYWTSPAAQDNYLKDEVVAERSIVPGQVNNPGKKGGYESSYHRRQCRRFP